MKTLSEFQKWDENNNKRRNYRPSSKLFANYEPEVGENISHRKNSGLFTQSLVEAYEAVMLFF